MKKTITMLAALAGVAMGITTDDALAVLTPSSTSGVSSLTLEETPEATSYFMTFVLSDTAVSSFRANNTVNSTIASLDFAPAEGSSDSRSMAVAIAKSNGIDYISAGGYVAGHAIGSGNPSFWTNKTLRPDDLPSDVAKVAITFGFDSADTNGTWSATLSYLDAEGNVQHFSSVAETTTTWNYQSAALKSISVANAYVSEAYLFSGEISGDNLKSAAAAVLVPEPATATLSLLALAGLAARRRRH